MSLSDFIVKVNNRQWTDAQIENLPDADRKALAIYNPDLTKTGISENLRNLIQKRGFSPADGVYAASLRHMKKTQSLSSVTPGEAAVQGGHVVIDDEQVSVMRTTGIQTLPNTPILGHLDEPDRRANLDTLTALCCSIVRVTKGVWVDNRSQEWADRYIVSPGGMKHLSNALIHVLTGSEHWTSMSTIARQGITGIPHTRFVRRVLNSLPKSDYDLLNTIVVVDVLEVVKRGRKAGSWLKTSNAKGEPSVPVSAYEMRPFTTKDSNVLRSYPCVFTYRGGFVPPVKPFVSSPDTSSTSAMAAFNREVSQWVQGDSSPISILSMNKGFGSQLTANTKKQLFLISATLSSWTCGVPAVIRLPSLGDFVPVLSSVSYWQTKILATKPGMFSKILEYSDGEGKPWFKFVLPNQSQLINNPQVMAHCVTKIEPLWTQVFIIDPSLPQKSEKSQQDPDWDTYSYTAYPTYLGQHYIGMCTVFGPAFFPEDPAMEKQLRGKSSTGMNPLVGCHVYAHALAKDFQAVISSFTNLELVGRKLVPFVNPDKTTSKIEEWTTVSLQHCPTRALWYDRVKKDLYNMFECPWRPVVRNCPIVNLLFVTKGKAELNSSMWMAEGGGSGFSGKVFVPPKSSNIVFEAPVADPNAPVGDDEEEDEDQEQGEPFQATFQPQQSVEEDDSSDEEDQVEEKTEIVSTVEVPITLPIPMTTAAPVETKNPVPVKEKKPKKRVKQAVFKTEGDDSNLDKGVIQGTIDDLQ